MRINLEVDYRNDSAKLNLNYTYSLVKKLLRPKFGQRRADEEKRHENQT